MVNFPLFAAILAALCSSIASAECWRDTECDGPAQAAFPGPWEDGFFVPDTRTLSPVRVLDGDLRQLGNWSPENIPNLSSNGSLYIFDWGLEVGGVVTIEFVANGTGSLGIAFSETSNFTGYMSDESNGGSGHDGALYTDISTSTGEDGQTVYKYTVPDDKARGGFRYLSLYTITNSTLDVSVRNMTVELPFHPNWGNMRAYGGYFHSSDDLLNRIWYGAAFTVQTNIMPTNTARVFPCLDYGWENNADLDTDGPGLGAGNKRDRAVWAADFGMALRSAAIALGDMNTLKRSLQLQYNVQQTTGELPWVPPPINIFGSDTYHMATLLATYDYILFSGDTDWLTQRWDKFMLGMSFARQKIDSSGLINVTGGNNWGRTAVSTGHTTDGNMLLYGCLLRGAEMSSWMNDTIGTQWLAQAETLKQAILERNWDPSVGAFWNTEEDHSNHCQDGNSMALYWNAVDKSHASNISNYLSTQWTPIGASCSELPGSIVMYTEGYEIKGHLAVGHSRRALDLIRRSWGWNLENPYGTESTFVEGYNLDGSWRYRDDSYSKNGSYTAHALGWSTGPVDALNSYIIGLRPSRPGGEEWILEPQFGDLQSAEGGFTTPLGKFSSGWMLEHNGTGFSVWLNTPEETTGQITLPQFAGARHYQVTLDGQTVVNGSSITIDVAGGKHQISAKY
ncbi:uncharacterized protein TRUGW13939_10321 [Talaromyces rugulosus]|uniref:Alpha-L-rhamnosidase six-hairpin glycosidase domain-containing protein n=1 Tax=Talaromyces rugulosus TaxID=121627 RepID=A0A7H8R9W2_TALRU|nr:uncharacterized protein TRUGW13939_10321 [Talaromyces rugulosus]QKX63152.1 hypothetical protein TRUGW13939_10321 [Talaromyces rugulosus]